MLSIAALLGALTHSSLSAGLSPEPPLGSQVNNAAAPKLLWTCSCRIDSLRVSAPGPQVTEQHWSTRLDPAAQPPWAKGSAGEAADLCMGEHRAWGGPNRNGSQAINGCTARKGKSGSFSWQNEPGREGIGGQGKA